MKESNQYADHPPARDCACAACMTYFIHKPIENQFQPLLLSEQLARDHASGDFGKALEGYAEAAAELERRSDQLASIEQFAKSVPSVQTIASQAPEVVARWFAMFANRDTEHCKRIHELEAELQEMRLQAIADFGQRQTAGERP